MTGHSVACVDTEVNTRPGKRSCVHAATCPRVRRRVRVPLTAALCAVAMSCQDAADTSSGENASATAETGTETATRLQPASAAPFAADGGHSVRTSETEGASDSMIGAPGTAQVTPPAAAARAPQAAGGAAPASAAAAGAQAIAHQAAASSTAASVGDAGTAAAGASAGVAAPDAEAQTAAADGKPAPTQSEGCGKADPQQGSARVPLNVDNHSYYVKLPSTYDPNTPYMALFVFHPTNNPLDWAEKNAGFEANDAKDNAIRIYPGAGNNAAGWNGSDVSFFGSLYGEITDNFCVDKARVFAMGESSGGDFASILGCEFADKLRGVGPCATKPVSGYPLQVDRRACSGRVAAVIIHGKNDNVVGPENGPATRDFYREVNGCGDKSEPVEGFTDSKSNCVKYQGCDDDHPVFWCQHDDPEYGGTNHGWPRFAAKFLWGLFSSY